MVTTLRTALLFVSSLLALQDKPEIPSRDDVKIEVIHDEKASCSEYPKAFRCSDGTHWMLSANGVPCADRSRVEAFIQSEAERRRTPDPKVPTLSELEIKIRAESGAPYSEAATLMNKCAKMGIYRVQLGEKKTEGRTGAITSALGVGTRAKVVGRDVLVLIGKQEPEKDDSVRWIESAGLKEAIDKAAKGQGPRDEIVILLDPIPSTPWTEVIQLMDSFKKMGYERLEFAAPKK